MECKFKVGDVVVRSMYADCFTHGTKPLVVAHVLPYRNEIQFAEDDDYVYWFASYFKLYQPEQQNESEVKPVMQPLVSNYDKALDLRITHKQLGDISLREFFCNLLIKLWDEQEGFSGKRPWGNSGWDEPVYAALIKAEIINGEFDSEGCIKSCDFGEGSEFISNMLLHVFGCSIVKE
jgi:hypothetical protein